VSSRRGALATLRQAVLAGGAGPVLITGEPGSGKTWLWRSLLSDLPGHWRSIRVDMSGALDALEFLRLIAAGLDLPIPDRLGAARLALAKAIREESADGRAWVLVVENVQDAGDEIWGEIKALAHAMEASEGFGALVLVGPTELAGRLSTRRFAAIAGRLEAHVHLLPLDVDEVRELLRGRAVLAQAELESLHRDAAGNPRRLLHLARREMRTLPGPISATPPPAPGPSAKPASLTPPGRDTGHQSSDRRIAPEAPLVPSRPPLRVEEGLIEVGWGGSLENEATASASDSTASVAIVENATPAPLDADEEPVAASTAAEAELPSEEMIEDHYAALQAWTEWAKNRGRGIGTFPATGGAADAAPEEHGESPYGTSDVPGALAAGRVWSEGQHGHAPYSQLFTRLRQSK
jgi:general secretion pathway protein A